MVRRSCLTLIFPLFAAVSLVALTGCDEAKVVVVGSANETDHPDYLEGKRLQAEGKIPEALQKFQSVIVSRRDAPESHLEAGALCVELKDPLQAIYHYRRYLTIRPDAQQAPVVKQRIRLAEKEFLKTLPFAPLEGNADDRIADLMEKLKTVRRENDQLKQQLGVRLAEAKAPAPTPRTAPQETADSTPATTAAPASAKRTYVIAKGDTLAAISLKVYGNKNRWKEIYQANRNVMKTERDLKVGVTLTIP